MIDGLTGDQRFFIGWALAWRSKSRDAELAAADRHRPAFTGRVSLQRRVAQPPEFYAAFGVKEGDKLWLAPETARADLVSSRNRPRWLSGTSRPLA